MEVAGEWKGWGQERATVRDDYQTRLKSAAANSGALVHLQCTLLFRKLTALHDFSSCWRPAAGRSPSTIIANEMRFIQTTDSLARVARPQTGEECQLVLPHGCQPASDHRLRRQVLAIDDSNVCGQAALSALMQ